MERKKMEDGFARERAGTLLDLAEKRYLEGDEKLSKRYVEIARKIAMRHRIRLGAKRFCKKCGVIFIWGETFKTRIAGKKPYRICAKCGNKRLAGRAR